MNRLDELHALLTENVAKVGELLKKEKEVEEEKCKSKCKPAWILGALCIVAVVAAAAYGLYRFFAPDYLEDFEDDFDDDFDDDFFEDEEEKAEEKTEDATEATADEADEATEDEVTDEMTEE